MTQTIPADLMERIADINVDELAHYGILGMKWGVRRFQKYPVGYSGDGKYVGPDGQPRQPTRDEARRDRKYQELKGKIDRWTNEAVNTGDKKKLKVLKKAMTSQEYQEAYDEMVRRGVDRAVKTMDKTELSKYKNDISPNEYKDRSLLIDFNDAINRLDTKRMNQLVSHMKNEEIKEATQRIATMTEFQNKKIGALKVENESSVKLAKMANTASNIASIAGSAKKVYNFINDVQKDKEARYEAEKKKVATQRSEKEKALIEDIIKRGDIKDFKANRSKFTNDQVEQFKKRVFLNNEKEINKAILTGDAATKEKWAEYIPRAQVETINKATTKSAQTNVEKIIKNNEPVIKAVGNTNMNTVREDISTTSIDSMLDALFSYNPDKKRKK